MEMMAVVMEAAVMTGVGMPTSVPAKMDTEVPNMHTRVAGVSAMHARMATMSAVHT